MWERKSDSYGLMEVTWIPNQQNNFKWMLTLVAMKYLRFPPPTLISMKED